MIIDCHAHYTQAPAALRALRGAQVRTRTHPSPLTLKVSDSELAGTLEKNLRAMDRSGITSVLLSPNAGWMGHDFGDERTSLYWAQVNNDLLVRVAQLAPARFTPVCMLPQSPGVRPSNCLAELERCAQMGVVACNVNPDVAAGGQPFTPGLGDEWWYPLWEKLVELDMPAMIHASHSLNPGIHPLGADYINADTAAVVGLCTSRVFEEFPSLKLVIPHGGGAVPYQWARYNAIHTLEGLPPFEEQVRNLYFDTVVFDDEALSLLIRRVGADRLLCGSEMFGAGRATNPKTARTFDQTVELIKESPSITDEDRQLIFEDNARRLYKRAPWALLDKERQR